MLFGQPCRELLHFWDCKAGEIPTNTSAAPTNSTKHPGTTWLLQKLSGGMCVKASSLQQPPCNEDK